MSAESFIHQRFHDRMVVRLLPPLPGHRLPFVKARRRHDAVAPTVSGAKRRFVDNRLAPAIVQLGADCFILGPMRDLAPSEQIGDAPALP
jgi:hypothetical protein